jgi:hypothetical protein
MDQPKFAFGTLVKSIHREDVFKVTSIILNEDGSYTYYNMDYTTDGCHDGYNESELILK